MTVPIIDPSVAADALLDARLQVSKVMDSTLAGQPLNDACRTAVDAVDSGLRIVRSMTTAAAA